MSDAPKNPFLKPHFVIGAAFLAAIGAGIAGLLFEQGRRAVEEATAGPALNVRVIPASEFVGFLNPIFSALVPDDGPQIDALSAPENRDRHWFNVTHEWSGYAAGSHVVRLELRTQQPRQVIIERIAARIVSREPPKPGWFIADGACGAMPMRIGFIDLDAVAPVAQIYDMASERQVNLFVTDADAELIEMHARTADSRVEWVLEIAYSAPNGPGTITVDDNGAPFRAAARVGSRAYTPDWQSGGFVRKPEWDAEVTMC